MAPPCFYAQDKTIRPVLLCSQFDRNLQVLVLFLSRIDRKKGLDLLVRAFARVLPQAPGTFLVIAGSGDAVYEREVRAQVESSGIGANVKWLGFVTGVNRLQAYRECDIFALTSYNENFGLVVVEAMYAGKPVLITTEVYLHETLASHGCAEICAPTLDAIEAGLKRLLLDPVLRKAMGARGVDAAAREYGPDAVRSRLQAVYHKAFKSVH